MKGMLLLEPNLKSKEFSAKTNLNVKNEFKIEPNSVESNKVENLSDVSVHASVTKNSSLKNSSKGNGIHAYKGFLEELRSYSLSELATFKLEVFFHQQRKNQVRIDGLYALIMEQVERPLIELSLKKFRGNQLRTAKMLGMNRNTLKRKIDFYKIKIQDVKGLKDEKMKLKFINH